MLIGATLPANLSAGSTATTVPTAGLPRIIRDIEVFLKNVDTAQRNLIFGNPEDFLCVMPNGAGERLSKLNPAFTDDTVNYLRGFDGCANVELVAAHPYEHPSVSRDFTPPGVFILSGFTTLGKIFLLTQQTFNPPSGILFHIIPFDIDFRPWDLAVYKGDCVSRDPARHKAAIDMVKEASWRNPDFRQVVAEIFPDPGRCLDEKVVAATASWDFIYTETWTTNRGITRVWILTGEPITDDPHLLEVIKTSLCTTFASAKTAAVLVPAPSNMNIGCVMCRHIAHPYWLCPFSLADNYEGYPLPPPPPTFGTASTNGLSVGNSNRGNGGTTRGGRGFANNGNTGNSYRGSRGGHNMGGARGGARGGNRGSYNRGRGF